jgi:pimeloyl-ACP methyl ester carboxylesterase
MFWQGSWQLLYHPTASISRTPASAGIAFDDVEFGSSPAGMPQLKGWWVPAGSQARYTAIFLHGATGNLSDTIDALARLHAAGVDVLAFDYRGYGQSAFARPSEERLRQDAEAATLYLADTRHVSPSSLVLVGNGLGANLALQLASAHSELAGVVLEEPLEAPMDAIFRDPRARLVPARLLVNDSWDAKAAAAKLRIPSLWFFRQDGKPAWFESVTSRKIGVWLANPATAHRDYEKALTRWLVDLSDRSESR